MPDPVPLRGPAGGGRRARPANPAPARARARGGAGNLRDYVPPELAAALYQERLWARDLDPRQAEGIGVEVRMLRQSLRDAFLLGDGDAVRRHAEALRRLLRERAVVPEMDDPAGAEGRLEDGLSADLRRVLRRVGLEMGIDA